MCADTQADRRQLRIRFVCSPMSRRHVQLKSGKHRRQIKRTHVGKLWPFQCAFAHIRHLLLAKMAAALGPLKSKILSVEGCLEQRGDILQNTMSWLTSLLVSSCLSGASWGPICLIFTFPDPNRQHVVILYFILHVLYCFFLIIIRR